MRITVLFFLLLFFNAGYAQLEPVRWSFDVERVSDTEYDIIFTARIDKGWSVYSPYLTSDNGPIPTTFEFYNNDLEAIGKAKEEGNRKETFDEMFGMNLIKFSGKARFTQRIKINESNTVSGHLTYMTCDDESCLPPADVNFEIALNR
ncbi:MAG: protein-disulfide reductase DsbD domain-containing protein [Bacteroidota bacterium]